MFSKTVAKVILFTALSTAWLGGKEVANAEIKTITATQDDLIVIPDKYNTGAKGALTHLDSCTEEERQSLMDGLLVYGGGTEDYRINLTKTPTKAGGYLVENVDFTGHRFYYTNTCPEKVKITFRNCKFKGYTGNGQVESVLEHCTIESISATNTTCNHCEFGHSYSDTIRAFNDATFNHCYISDLQYPMYSDNPNASQHIDGVQIFGNLYPEGKTKGEEAGNIHFYNCRFEIPTYYIDDDNKAGMNDCIMVQTEYSDAKDITFENIITNGANYQFSAHGGSDPKTKEARTIDDVSLTNCRMGEGSIRGAMTSVEPEVKLENVGISTVLYVGSTWKDTAGVTHFSVTNDSSQPRTLTIVTDKETKSVTIPAYLQASITNEKTAENKNKYKFSDYPIDLDIEVSGDKYAVCYDTTFTPQQVRFVNYTGEAISLDEDILKPYTGEIKVIKQGSCGKQASYTLTNDGVLTISGHGTMDNYHSKLLPPWDRVTEEDVTTAAVPKPYIRKIVIENGITSIGAQAFNGRGSVQEVILPDTIETISSRAFAGCNSLLKLTIPASLKEVGKDAFVNVFGLRIQYLGEDWSKVTGGESLASMIQKPIEEPIMSPGPDATTDGKSEAKTSKAFVKAVKIKKVVAGKKKMKVILKKSKQKLSGYQIWVATNKKFTKNLKKVTWKKKTTKVIKGLKKGKRYYIRVRAYRIKEGKKQFSSWSCYKKRVRIKR